MSSSVVCSRRGSATLPCLAYALFLVIVLASWKVAATRDDDAHHSSSRGFPVGTMLFFASQHCPDHWFEVESVRGRLIVSVSNGDDGGITVGTALKDREDRTHAHPFSTQVSIPVQNVAAVDCCNDQSAAAGLYPVSNVTFPGVSMYPFAQLLFCRYSGPNEEDGDDNNDEARRIVVGVLKKEEEAQRSKQPRDEPLRATTLQLSSQKRAAAASRLMCWLLAT